MVSAELSSRRCPQCSPRRQRTRQALLPHVFERFRSIPLSQLRSWRRLRFHSTLVCLSVTQLSYLVFIQLIPPHRDRYARKVCPHGVDSYLRVRAAPSHCPICDRELGNIGRSRKHQRRSRADRSRLVSYDAVSRVQQVVGHWSGQRHVLSYIGETARSLGRNQFNDS